MKVIAQLKIYLNKTQKSKNFTTLPWHEKWATLFKATEFDELYSLLYYLVQLEAWLSENEITNLIQFSLDNTIYYNDAKSHPNDLALALKILLQHKIREGNQFKLLLEEEHPAFQSAIQLKFSDKHLKNEPALEIKYIGVPRNLLQQKKEKFADYQQRLLTLFQEPKLLKKEIKQQKEQLQKQLNKLEESLPIYLDLKKCSSSIKTIFYQNETEYMFSYNPDIWQEIHYLTCFSEQFYREPRSEKDQFSALKDVVRESKKTFKALLNRLFPVSSYKNLGILRSAQTLPPRRTWTQYVTRKVFNPKSGRITQIRSLPPNLQQPYRESFLQAGGKLPKSRQHKKEKWFDLLETFSEQTQRGLNQQIEITIEEMKAEAPRTHAFLTNETYRAEVLQAIEKRVGSELCDLADLLSSTIVGEILELRYLPYTWCYTKSGPKNEKQRKLRDKGTEQLLDIGELLVGTLLPVTGLSIGGPIGGILGLSVVLALSQSVEYNEQRKVTIAPSTFIKRRKQIKEKRKVEKIKQKVRLITLRGGVLEEEDLVAFRKIKEKEITKKRMKELFAERFKEYGKELLTGQKSLKEAVQDLKTLKHSDILYALKQEKEAQKEPLPKPWQEIETRIDQIQLP